MGIYFIMNKEEVYTVTPLIPKEELIKQLIKRRQEVGLTQDELAETIRHKFNNKISVITISRIECGQLNSKYETLYQIDNTIEKFENIIKSQKNKNFLAISRNERLAHVAKLDNKSLSE